MRIGWVLGVLGAGCIAGGASAQVITNPDWLQRPTAEDMTKHFPVLASGLDLGGYATLSCQVDSQGLLRACESIGASPKGLGFDHAAKALAAEFRMQPKRINGKPVEGGTVRIPIRFTLPQADAPSAPPSLPPPSARNLGLARQVIAESKLVEGPLAQRRQWLASTERASQGKVDPEVLKAGLAALKAADAETVTQVTEIMAGELARTLDTGALEAWVTYLRSPAARTMMERQTELAQGVSNAFGARLTPTMLRAREAFCRNRDCASVADLTDMRRMDAAGEVAVSAPEWSETPSYAQISAAFPAIARTFQIDGWALLHCRATALGLLTACEVMVERPKGLGFGTAAISLTDRYRLSLKMLGQGAAGEKVAVPVSFRDLRRTPDAAPPPTVAPARMALARQVVEAMGVTAAYGKLADAWAAELEKPREGLDAATREGASKAFKEAVAAETPALVESLAGVYAGLFDEADLKTHLAFQQSPAGRLTGADGVAFQERIMAMFKAVGTTNAARAKAIFCKTQDCKTAPGPPRAEAASGP